MRVDDVKRKDAREKFLVAARSVYGRELGERHAVPYTDGDVHGFMSALAMGVDPPTDNEAGLRMTAEWHKPVSAVLNYFQVERVTLIGLSLGRCLVMRAAALEPRIERVIAYDIFTNGLDVTLRQAPAVLRGLLKVLLRLRAASVVNWMVARVARKSPVVQWGLQEGMHVTGTHSAFGFLQAFRQFETADVSASITQDVLLLAGSEDHYIPLEQWHDQMRMLKNAHLITARLFTRGARAEPLPNR